MKFSQSGEGKNKKFQGTHGFEPWTYRTAADCSTTELYPQSILRSTEFVVCIKFGSKYKGTPTQIFYFDVLILLLFQDCIIKGDLLLQNYLLLQN